MSPTSYLLLPLRDINGGPDGIRTRDLLRDRQAFYSSELLNH